MAGRAAQGPRLSTSGSFGGMYDATGLSVGVAHPAEPPRADMCGRASVRIWRRCATRQVRSAANDKGVTAGMEEEMSLTWHDQLEGEVTSPTLIGVRQAADHANMTLQVLASMETLLKRLQPYRIGPAENLLNCSITLGAIRKSAEVFA